MSDVNQRNPGFSIQELLDLNHIDLNDSDYLDLSELGIRSLEGLQNIPNVESKKELDLSDNVIKTIEKGIFSCLTNLQKLKINYNYELTTIEPDAFGDLKNLQELSFFGNNVTVEPGVFHGLAQLKQLRISTKQKIVTLGTFSGLTGLEKLVFQTRCTDILPGTFNELAKLAYFEFTSENITVLLTSNTFSGLANLRQLRLCGFREQSKLTTLMVGAFKGLTTLRHLEIDRFPNLIVCAPGVFSDLTQLEVLLLTFTGITTIDHQMFRGLSHLKILQIYNGRLDDKFLNVEPEAFANLSKLENLNLIEHELTGQSIQQIKSELPPQAEIVFAEYF